MKRVLYFDCFSGISGDMAMAALIDLGLDQNMVRDELAKLHLSGYELDIKKTHQLSISGTDVTVRLTSQDGAEHFTVNQEDQRQEGHFHETYDYKHAHGFHTHDHQNLHTMERNLSDISKIILDSHISQNAKDLAIDIFREIALAEAKVHGKPVEDVHFHEIGAVDSIVDIVGTAICFDLLKVDMVVCSPVREGRGFVQCRHGVMPIPVPAVAQMLQGSDIELITGDVEKELVTPTGFGILKVLMKSCGKMPKMNVLATGYGFGKTHTGKLNALRIFLGTVEEVDKHINPSSGMLNLPEDIVYVMETNLDDCTGEVLGYTMERLFEEGALDVYFTPIQMKKNRPAHMVSVICNRDKIKTLSELLFKETGTLGLRIRETKRIIAHREVKSLDTEFGQVRIKYSQTGEMESFKPELDNCKDIAKKYGLPLKEVQRKLNRDI